MNEISYQELWYAYKLYKEFQDDWGDQLRHTLDFIIDETGSNLLKDFGSSPVPKPQ